MAKAFSGNEPHKGSRRTILLLFFGVLVTLLAIYIFMSFVKQSKVSPGNTEARPSMLVLPLR